MRIIYNNPFSYRYVVVDIKPTKANIKRLQAKLVSDIRRLKASYHGIGETGLMIGGTNLSANEGAMLATEWVKDAGL